MQKRSEMVSLLAAALLALALAGTGCSKEGGGGAAGGSWEAAEKVVSAWKAAGLEATGFAKVDGTGFGGGECQTGKVAGLETTLCQHPSADKAKEVQPQALKQVGENTGYAIANGELVLVVADRGKADPTGRTMNKMARTFQGQ